MPEVLVDTPLNYSAATRPYEFADGISIREISPILWDISVVKGYVSAADKTKMDEAKYWICASQKYEYVLSQTGDELYTRLEMPLWRSRFSPHRVRCTSS